METIKKYLKKDRWKLALWTTCMTIVWFAGWWSFTFWKILENGYVKYIEPNRFILVLEFCVATGISVIALIVGVAILLNIYFSINKEDRG